MLALANSALSCRLEERRVNKASAEPASVPAQLSNTELCFKSDDLFRDARTVCIEHSGQRYLLRLTRENKLILTK